MVPISKRWTWLRCTSLRCTSLQQKNSQTFLTKRWNMENDQNSKVDHYIIRYLYFRMYFRKVQEKKCHWRSIVTGIIFFKISTTKYIYFSLFVNTTDICLYLYYVLLDIFLLKYIKQIPILHLFFRVFSLLCWLTWFRIDFLWLLKTCSVF